MKITSIKKVFGSLAVATVLVTAPSVFAADVNATTSSSVRINSDGIVHVVGAEVTSISGTIVTALSHFKNTIVTWTFATNASTTVNTNPTTVDSTTDIRVGDRLNVTGALSAFGSTISVNATKIKDMTTLALWRGRTGTVHSVNIANGTFVLMSNDKLITVQTNASTTFGFAPATSTVPTLATLALNSRVVVAGISNSNGTVITATKVIVTTNSSTVVKNNDKNHDSKNESKDKKEHEDNGKHKGLLKTHFNLGVGVGTR